MSFDPILWAMKDAPVANVEEWAVVVAQAERADDDGCNTWISQATIASRTRLSVKTVGRRLADMEARGLIARGDQSRVAHIPADKRPVNYDLQIPFSWFPNIDRIQQYRLEQGRPPLTPEIRPPVAPAPPAKRRRDFGIKKEPIAPSDGDRTTSPVAAGLVVRSRPDCKSPATGLVVQSDGTASPTTFPQDLSPRHSPELGGAGNVVHLPSWDQGDDAEATLPGMPPAPHRPTAKPKQVDPAHQKAMAICSVWWNALPQKPLGRDAYRNVVLIVAEAVRVGDWNEDQLAAALRACGPSVTIPALNHQLARLYGQQANTGGRPRVADGNTDHWRSGGGFRQTGGQAR